MSLSKRQKDFLKTIKNPKDKKHQKQQFKLQNKFYKFGLVEEIIFIDGIFKTDNPELIAFFNECPMVEKIEENSLTKESLRDITEPKTANENIPKEFCVEITEENKEVLTKVYNQSKGTHFKDFVNGTFMIKYGNSDELYNVVLDVILRNETVNISTEEFLRYIGKEELIEKPKTKFSEYPEHTFGDLIIVDGEKYKNVTIGDVVGKVVELSLEKIYSAKTDEPKPLDFDLPKKLDNIISIECLSIKDILESEILIKSSPLCQKLKDYLVDLVNYKTNPLNLK